MCLLLIKILLNYKSYNYNRIIPHTYNLWSHFDVEINMKQCQIEVVVCKPKKITNLDTMNQVQSDTESLIKYGQPEVVEIISNKKTKKPVAPVQANPQQALIDFLDQIVPPKKFNDGALDYVQHLSTQQTSRSDIIALEEQLENLIKTRKARMTGIDPIKSQLYDECFNEVIRQVAVDSTERASLLICIRDEIKESIDGYEKQYESITAHSIRSAIHKEQNKNALIKENEKLEAEIKAFEDRIADLKKRTEDAEANDAADSETKKKDHLEKLAQLRAENAAIRKKLEEYLVSPIATETTPPKK